MKPLNLLYLVAASSSLITPLAAQLLDTIFKAELYTAKDCTNNQEGKGVLTLDYGEEGRLPNLLQNPEQASLDPSSTFVWSTQRLKITKLPKGCVLELYDQNRQAVGGDYTKTGKCILIPKSNIMEFAVSCPSS